MDQNFTLIDLRAVALAVVLFPLFAVVPGYALAACTNVFSFRQRLLSTRFLIGIVISISVFPILAYWLGMLSMRAIWAVTAIFTAGVAVQLVRELRRGVPRPSRVHLQFVLIGASWALIAVGSLVDLQIHDRLYFTSTVVDQSVRAPMTNAISRTGVLPASPFFFPGSHVPLRYHYLWYIVPSLVDQLGGKIVSPRHALIAASVWCGIGLIALVALYLRFFDARGSDEIHRRCLIGVGLLALNGLDLIPVILMTNFGKLRAEMDSWNSVVASWMSTMLWGSHHVVGMTACLTGFLLLWYIQRGSNTRAHIVLAAGAFASAVGSQIYVALVFATFLAVWIAILLVRRCYRDCAVFLATGALAAILSLPYLFRLVSGGAVSTGGAAQQLPLMFTVRSFDIVHEFLDGIVPGRVWLIQLVDFAFLPLNYFLELGFFFVVGWLTLAKYRKSHQLTRQQLALSAMLITTVVLCSFVRSSVISNNDFGWRGFLFAQFVLVLWSVDFWPELPKLGYDARLALKATLMIGIYGTVYQVFMLRMYPIFMDQWVISGRSIAEPNSPSLDGRLGFRTLGIRRGYAELESMLPADATIQFNPRGDTAGYLGGLYANRQIVAFDIACASVFGGTGRQCDAVIPRILPIFEAHAEPPTNLDYIDVLVFQDTDPAWADRTSWIWQMKPLVANDYFRAFSAKAILSRQVPR